MFLATSMLLLPLLLSSIILATSNPLLMGALILSMALTLTASTALFITSWLALLIFLIYISGMLVLFAYFLSLTPNIQSNLQSSPYSLLLISPLLLIYTQSHMPLIPTFNMFLLNTYIMSNSILLIILATALLLALIIIVKMSLIQKGPLRPFSYV